MCKRYREAFKETLCCCFGHRKSKYQRSLIYYYNNMKSTVRSHSSPGDDKQPGQTDLNNSDSRNSKRDPNYSRTTKLLSNSVKAREARQNEQKVARAVTYADNEYHSENEDVKLLTYLPLNKAENVDTVVPAVKSNIHSPTCLWNRGGSIRRTNLLKHWKKVHKSLWMIYVNSVTRL